MTAAAAKQARALVSRAVIWAGLALGTAVTVLAVMNGIRVPRLEIVLSVLATWALLALLAVVAVELLRRHHRAIGRHGWRYGKRGAIATARGARAVGRGAAARSLPWRTRVLAALRARWAARGREPLMVRRTADAAGAGTEGPEPRTWPGLEETGEDPAGGREGRAEGGEPGPDSPSWSWGPEASPSGWPAASRVAAENWARHMSGDGKPYVVTEYPPGGGPGRTVATYVNSKPATEGDSMPASPSRIKTEHRARRAAARSGGTVPAEWGPVIAAAADFEPENDGELLEWMSRQVTGLSGWAEALVDFYEHATSVIGIDPAASAMLHDVADAAAQAAETMGAAKAKFTEHYELPREFAANGGLMTHDGRWVTGEGA
jgi:hypothetical protein